MQSIKTLFVYALLHPSSLKNLRLHQKNISATLLPFSFVSALSVVCSPHWIALSIFNILNLITRFDHHLLTYLPYPVNVKSNVETIRLLQNPVDSPQPTSGQPSVDSCQPTKGSTRPTVGLSGSAFHIQSDPISWSFRFIRTVIYRHSSLVKSLYICAEHYSIFNVRALYFIIGFLHSFRHFFSRLERDLILIFIQKIFKDIGDYLRVSY